MVCFLVDITTNLGYISFIFVYLQENLVLDYMIFTTEDNRIYATSSDNRVIAELTFTVKDGVANINHTFVDDSLRGQGVAGQLVQAAVDHFLKRNLKISATCSYAFLWLKRHPEYESVPSETPAGCDINGRH